jgi:sugar lactone lactonase YvrE
MTPRPLFLAALTVVALTLAAPVAQAAPPFLGAWGTKGSGPGQFNVPDGLAIDSAGHVYVADRENNRLQVFAADGTFLAAWTNGLKRPYGVAVDDRGSVYVLDTDNNRVQQFTADGTPVRMWGSKGQGDGQFNDPRGIGVGPDGTVYVADHGNNRVEAFTPDGTFVRRWGRNGGDGSAGSGPGEFDQPRGMVTDSTGAVYVVEKRNNRVQKFTADGQFVTAFGGLGAGDGQLNLPYNAAIDASGNLFVTDVNNNRIDQFTLDGRFLDKWGRNGGDGSEGSGPGEFHDPYGVAIDCRGGVYVSDEENSRIQRFGDPAAPPPTCAPAVRLAALRAGARGATLKATCDRACTLVATAKASVGRGKPVALKAGAALDPGTPSRLALQFPARLRRALANGRGRLTVRISALGIGGASPAVVRRLALR